MKTPNEGLVSGPLGQISTLKWELPKGAILSARAVESVKWGRHLERIFLCGDERSRAWIAGRRRTNPKMGFVRPAHCHSRHHEKCRPHDARERIENLTEPDFWNYNGARSMITLTLRRKNLSADARDFFWLTFWARFRRFTNLWKKHGLPRLRYVAVLERHESGWPHLHLATRLMPWKTMEDKKGNIVAGGDCQAAVSQLWKACGGGYSVNWLVLRESNGCYAGKYLDKGSCLSESLQALITCNKVRLINSSPGLKPAKLESEYEWKRGSRGECEQFLDNGKNGG